MIGRQQKRGIWGKLFAWRAGPLKKSQQCHL